jgi:hypothetical protein
VHTALTVPTLALGNLSVLFVSFFLTSCKSILVTSILVTSIREMRGVNSIITCKGKEIPVQALRFPGN